MIGRTLVLVVALVALPGCATAVTFARLERQESVPPRGADAVRTPDGAVHVRAHYEDAPSRGFVIRHGRWAEGDAGALPPVGDRVTVSRTPVADGIVLEDDGRCRLMALGATDACGTLAVTREAPGWRRALPWALLPFTLTVDVATLPVQTGLLIAVMSSDRGLIGGVLP